MLHNTAAVRAKPQHKKKKNNVVKDAKMLDIGGEGGLQSRVIMHRGFIGIRYSHMNYIQSSMNVSLLVQYPVC